MAAIRYRTADVDGYEIFYLEAGDPARPTLLLFAWGGARRAQRRSPRRRTTPLSSHAGAGWCSTHVSSEPSALLGDVVAAVLVQLERQDGYPESKERQTSYGGPASVLLARSVHKCHKMACQDRCAAPCSRKSY
jgi:hypothetical protein